MLLDSDPQPDDLKLYCRVCGYELTNLTRSICPECGTEFDEEDAMSVVMDPQEVETAEADELLRKIMVVFVSPLVLIFLLGVVFAIVFLIGKVVGFELF